jgi:hypothetical protein
MTKSEALKLEYRIKQLPAGKKIAALTRQAYRIEMLKKDLRGLQKEIKALEKTVELCRRKLELMQSS